MGSNDCSPFFQRRTIHIRHDSTNIICFDVGPLAVKPDAILQGTSCPEQNAQVSYSPKRNHHGSTHFRLSRRTTASIFAPASSKLFSSSRLLTMNTFSFRRRLSLSRFAAATRRARLSAKPTNLALPRSANFRISSYSRLHTSGPGTDPCGTPVSILTLFRSGSVCTFSPGNNGVYF